MVNKRVQTLLEQLRAQGIRDEHVLEALAQVPREKFVDGRLNTKRGKTWRCPSDRARRFHSLTWWRA